MTRPATVQLMRHDGRAWLTDKYVMLDVTSSPAIDGLDGGWYRLTSTKGLTARDGIEVIDVAAYLAHVRHFQMYPVTPTPWCIRHNKAKAMLCYVTVRLGVRSTDTLTERIPLGINEDLWDDFLLSYPNATLAHSGYDGPFVVSSSSVKEQAFIEPVRIPQERQAEAIAIIDSVAEAEALETLERYLAEYQE